MTAQRNAQRLAEAANEPRAQFEIEAKIAERRVDDRPGTANDTARLNYLIDLLYADAADEMLEEVCCDAADNIAEEPTPEAMRVSMRAAIDRLMEGE